MKKTLLIFVCLLSVFFIAWGIKMNAPINRPSNIEDEELSAWYEDAYTKPIADEEWILDENIPENFIPVPGKENLFMEIDESGNILAYHERTSDGIFKEVNPDIPDNYELINEENNVYKVVNEKGDISYFIYVRNEDDTFAFVDCDENGIPYYNDEDAGVISNNFVHIQDNIYSVYNENGVKEGFAERVPSSNGGYHWEYRTPEQATIILKPEITSIAGITITPFPTLTPVATISPAITGGIEDLPDGTYTITVTETETKQENNYLVVYEITTYNVMDKDGNIITSYSSDPVEISRTEISDVPEPNKSLIQPTLNLEYDRICSLVTFDTVKANEVLKLINESRAAEGLAPLTMNTSSEAYKLACIRAGDMAYYEYAAGESPMYGTINDLVEYYGCITANVSENVWQTGEKTATAIHNRLQSYEGSRKPRMSSSYTEVGIAIVTKDGYDYIAEIYLK